MAPATERKDFETTKKLREVMGNYFAELGRGPAEGKKTAWCTSVGPAELLWALGFNVYFPENHGAMLGAARMATDLISVANARGFSPDICSYLTSDVGSHLKGESPLQKMKLSGPPKADVLVFNTNQCRDVKDWFQFYAREWNVPCVGVHTPRSIGEVDGPLVEYVAGQIEGLVEPLEAVAGQKLDIDRLRQVIGISKQTTLLWKSVLETAAHVPAPITFFDGTIQMGPAVVMRGLEAAGDYYKALLAELRQRSAAGVPAVAGERLRIYWEGMPIWGKLSALGGLFLQLQTCVVASTYCNSWIFEALDPADPFHLPLRRPQGSLHRADGRAVSRRRHPLPRRQDLPQQLELPLRHAAAAPEEAGQALLDRQRRSERSPPLFGGADADQHRGVCGAIAPEVVETPWHFGTSRPCCA